MRTLFKALFLFLVIFQGRSLFGGRVEMGIYLPTDLQDAINYLAHGDSVTLHFYEYNFELEAEEEAFTIDIFQLQPQLQIKTAFVVVSNLNIKIYHDFYFFVSRLTVLIELLKNGGWSINLQCKKTKCKSPVLL